MWQTASDFIIFIGWFFKNLWLLVGYAFQPIQYVFTFIKSYVVSAFAPPIPATEIWAFQPEILAVFNAIPYWNTIIAVIVICLLIIFGTFIVKQFLKT